MRSTLVAALCLSLVHDSTARIPHSFRQLAERETQPEPQHGIFSWFTHLIKKTVDRRQETVCYRDDYYDFAANATVGKAFCEALMEYPNTTVTVDYTPRVYDLPLPSDVNPAKADHIKFSNNRLHHRCLHRQ